MYIFYSLYFYCSVMKYFYVHIEITYLEWAPRPCPSNRRKHRWARGKRPRGHWSSLRSRSFCRRVCRGRGRRARWPSWAPVASFWRGPTPSKWCTWFRWLWGWGRTCPPQLRSDRRPPPLWSTRTLSSSGCGTNSSRRLWLRVWWPRAMWRAHLWADQIPVWEGVVTN